MHRWPLLKQGQEKHGMAMKVYRFRMRPVFFVVFFILFSPPESTIMKVVCFGIFFDGRSLFLCNRKRYETGPEVRS